MAKEFKKREREKTEGNWPGREVFCNGWLDRPETLLRTSKRNARGRMTMTTMFHEGFLWARHWAKSFAWNAHSALTATL